VVVVVVCAPPVPPLALLLAAVVSPEAPVEISPPDPHPPAAAPSTKAVASAVRRARARPKVIAISPSYRESTSEAIRAFPLCPFRRRR
jgi:hypothetical protein